MGVPARSKRLKTGAKQRNQKPHQRRAEFFALPHLPDVSSITVLYDNWINLSYKVGMCLFSS
jgi:hypothetical protein